MYKTLHGLVLREVKYKESSKILTILTEEEGKITLSRNRVPRRERTQGPRNGSGRPDRNADR